MQRKGRVFLCHNSRDKEMAKSLAVDMLSSIGLRAWIDTWEIPGGANWEKHIRSAFVASSSCLVLLGPAGFGPYQQIEIGWAKERQAIDPDYLVIPILFAGVVDVELAGLEELLPKIHWVDLRDGWAAPDALQPIWNALKGDGPGPPLQVRNVAVAAEEWDRLGRGDRSTLIRGAALRKAQSLAQQPSHPFDELSLEFLSASAAEQQRKTRLAVIGLTASLVALAGGIFFVNSERQIAANAATQRQIAFKKESAALVKESEALGNEKTARDQEHIQRERAEDRQRLATARELAGSYRSQHAVGSRVAASATWCRGGLGSEKWTSPHANPAGYFRQTRFARRPSP
jgi:TIR domain